MKKESIFLKFVEKVLNWIAFIFLGIPIFIFTNITLILPVGIIGWQVYSYLRYGHWIPISIIDGLAWLGFGWALNSNQANWVGVYEILSFLPVGLGIWLLALFSLIIWVVLNNLFDWK